MGPRLATAATSTYCYLPEVRALQGPRCQNSRVYAGGKGRTRRALGWYQGGRSHRESGAGQERVRVADAAGTGRVWAGETIYDGHVCVNV